MVCHHRIPASEVIVDIAEVYRYLGFPKPVVLGERGGVPQETVELVAECLEQMRRVLRPQGVYEVFPVTVVPAVQADTPACGGSRLVHSQPPVVEFAGQRIESHALAKNLSGCDKVVLVAATIGPQVDVLIRRWTKVDASRAAVFQAAGAMFVESYLDSLNARIASDAFADGFVLRPRYSPGYGDVPLSVQKLFFSLLPCTQRIGLTLTNALVMAPEKSVTAFIGMEAQPRS